MLIAPHGRDGRAKAGSREMSLLGNVFVWAEVRKAQTIDSGNEKEKVFWR